MAGKPQQTESISHVEPPFPFRATPARRGRISDATLEALTRRGQEAAGVAKSRVDSSSFAVHALRGMIPFRRGTKLTHGGHRRLGLFCYAVGGRATQTVYGRHRVLRSNFDPPPDLGWRMVKGERRSTGKGCRSIFVYGLSIQGARLLPRGGSCSPPSAL
jgi:hypothetical protein